MAGAACAVPFALTIRHVEDVLACTWHHVLDTSACLFESGIVGFKDSPRKTALGIKTLVTLLSCDETWLPSA